MKRPILLLTFLAIGACSDQEILDEIAFLVAADVEELAAARSYWPNFDPLAIPLAIYDGEQTYLFRHPAVPEGFTEAENGDRRELIYKGRHPAVTANSSADIGETMTATLLVADVEPGQSIRALAGVAIHEAFHVFQRERHPGWAANEGDLFVYPIDDPELLMLRRLETEALRRALDESDAMISMCWTNRALALRANRFAEMDAQFATYERGTEMNEGLATYIQLKADGRDFIELPNGGFGATDVRARAYDTGAAFALLLDRTDEGWTAAFEANDQQSLDQALQSALATSESDTTSLCSFSNLEITKFEEIAQNDVAAVTAAQMDRRAKFDELDTWRIVIQASDREPLWPQGFDPLNVLRVQGGVIHTRFVRLGNNSGYVESMDDGGVDIEALTVGVGPHPLFNGIEQVSFVGIEKPELMTEDEHVVIRMPGLEAEFERAIISTGTKKIVVQLKPAK